LLYRIHKRKEALRAEFIQIKDYEAAKEKGFQTRSEYNKFIANKIQKDKDAKRVMKEKNEENCKQDSSCWKNKNLLSATFACDHLVEKASSFAFEWTDGLLEAKFSRFNAKNNEVITCIGDKIKFQNKFGAWENYIYKCDFNTEKQVVLDIRLRHGHLP